MERLVRKWTSMQRTRRSTHSNYGTRVPYGGPLTQLALGLHTVARQRMQQQQSGCGTYQAEIVQRRERDPTTSQATRLPSPRPPPTRQQHPPTSLCTTAYGPRAVLQRGTPAWERFSTAAWGGSSNLETRRFGKKMNQLNIHSLDGFPAVIQNRSVTVIMFEYCTQ